MPKRITFSNQNLNIQDYAVHRDDFRKSVEFYFSPAAPSFVLRFVTYTQQGIKDELRARLDELEMTSTLAVLTAVEAAFRIDYLQRCQGKMTDSISRDFRSMHKNKQTRVSLEDEILNVWKKHTIGSNKVISDLRAAFKFRHWLSHGRYWVQKFERNKFDFDTVYALASNTMNSFSLFGP